MSETILFIDDHLEEMKTWMRTLEAEGYRILTAHSGEEALERMKSGLPDCIICELEMEGMSGQQVMEAFSQMPGSKNVAFLLVNDDWTIYNWSRPTKNGRTADCHISKENDPIELLTFINRIFRYEFSQQPIKLKLMNVKILRNGSDGGHLYVSGVCNFEGNVVTTFAFFSTKEEERAFESRFDGQNLNVATDEWSFVKGAGLNLYNVQWNLE